MVTKWWWQEVWAGVRSPFIEVTKDTLLFVFVLFVIYLMHPVIDLLPVSAERKHFLGTVHFVVLAGLSTVFVFCLFIKVAVLQFNGLKTKSGSR